MGWNLEDGGVPDGVAGAHADPLGKRAVLLLLLAELLLNLEGLLGRLLMGGTGGWGAKVSVGSSVLCGGALQTLKNPGWMGGTRTTGARSARPDAATPTIVRTRRVGTPSRASRCSPRVGERPRAKSPSHPNPKHTPAPETRVDSGLRRRGVRERRATRRPHRRRRRV